MQGRTVIDTNNTDFEVYDGEGPVQEDMSWLLLSYDRDTGQGAYMIRMQPGAQTILHTHKRQEEFLILEGEAIEDDGTVLRAGDYVIYEAGTRHCTRTETGCVVIGFDWHKPGHERDT